MKKYSFMNEVKKILKKSQIENSIVSNILIEISNRFSKNKHYIDDARYELRKELVLELWETSKQKDMSKDNIYSLIARKVKFIDTNKEMVRKIISEGCHGK